MLVRTAWVNQASANVSDEGLRGEEHDSDATELCSFVLPWVVRRQREEGQGAQRVVEGEDSR